jgi:hypothetical protein
VLLGTDAYAPDQQDWIGAGFGPITPPPLGWSFVDPTAFISLNITISQPDACLQAQAQEIIAAVGTWQPPTASPQFVPGSAAETNPPSDAWGYPA